MADAGVPFDTAVLALELAEYLSSQDECRRVLTGAITTLEQLGAQPWLRRARVVVAHGAGGGPL